MIETVFVKIGEGGCDAMCPCEDEFSSIHLFEQLELFGIVTQDLLECQISRRREEHEVKIVL